ncbi:hypothetical protein EME01_42040 [Sinorhizobium meliloti]|jgi:hypothetical protein|nr:hypothetical protein EME01_42040 [Sinorhizobium meliloti]
MAAGRVSPAVLLGFVQRNEVSMAMNENVPGDTMMADRRARPSRIRLHPLHEAAMRIADIGLNRSKAKTRDLVGMLLTHGARAWRSTQPRAGIHLHVAAPGRSRPLRIRLH